LQGTSKLANEDRSELAARLMPGYLVELQSAPMNFVR
jgi:hypothetical protein